MANFRKKNEYYYLSGKTSWYRADVANKWNKWSHQLHPDAPSMEILRDLQAEGLKNMIKKDDDGYFLNISRPVTKQTASGKVLTFQPPETFDKDGVPYKGAVGNGSDVTTKIEVYWYTPVGGNTQCPAMRWVSTRIDNLVPFNPDSDLNEYEKEAAEGLKDQPQKDFF